MTVNSSRALKALLPVSESNRWSDSDWSVWRSTSGKMKRRLSHVVLGDGIVGVFFFLSLF